MRRTGLVVVGVCAIGLALLGGYAARDLMAQPDDEGPRREDRDFDRRDPPPGGQGFRRGPMGMGPGGMELPAPGQTCTVYLRGDAAGAAFGDRVPDVGNLINRTGTVVRAGPWGLVIEADGRRLWVPMTSIMLVESDAGEAGRRDGARGDEEGRGERDGAGGGDRDRGRDPPRERDRGPREGDEGR